MLRHRYPLFVFVNVIAASIAVPDAFEALRKGVSVGTALKSLVNVTITIVTVVLTLNQLVLYTVIASLVVAVSMLLLVEPSAYAGHIFGTVIAVLLVGGAVSITVITFRSCSRTSFAS